LTALEEKKNNEIKFPKFCTMGLRFHFKIKDIEIFTDNVKLYESFCYALGACRTFPKFLSKKFCPSSSNERNSSQIKSKILNNLKVSDDVHNYLNQSNHINFIIQKQMEENKIFVHRVGRNDNVDSIGNQIKGATTIELPNQRQYNNNFYELHDLKTPSPEQLQNMKKSENEIIQNNNIEIPYDIYNSNTIKNSNNSKHINFIFKNRQKRNERDMYMNINNNIEANTSGMIKIASVTSSNARFNNFMDKLKDIKVKPFEDLTKIGSTPTAEINNPYSSSIDKKIEKIRNLNKHLNRSKVMEKISSETEFEELNSNKGLKKGNIHLLFKYMRNNQNQESLPKYSTIKNNIPSRIHFTKSFVNKNTIKGSKGLNNELESLKLKVHNGDDILELLNQIEKKSLNKSSDL